MCNVQQPLVLAKPVGSSQCSLPCAPAYHDLGLAAECLQAHTERLQGSHRAGLLQNSSMAPAVLLPGSCRDPAGSQQGCYRAPTEHLQGSFRALAGLLRGLELGSCIAPAYILQTACRVHAEPT